MNMNRIFRYVAAAAILLTACSKFDDMNKNPYALYDAPAESFVQPILYNTEYTLVSRSYDLLSELMQYSVNYNTEVTSQMNYNYSITESVDASSGSDFILRPAMRNTCCIRRRRKTTRR